MQTLRELAVGGYHTLVLDTALVSRLLKYLQPASGGTIISLESEEAPTCLHRASLEVLEALISASSYNAQNLIATGMIRVICQNFQNFRVKKDAMFDSVFNSSFKDQDAKQLENLRGVKFLSLNHLF
jgi:hypothetical protein